MTHVLHRPIAHHCREIFIRDETGKGRVGRRAVSCLGHSHAPPFIIDHATVDMVVERLGDAIDAAVAT
jgi:adenosylmethionine-8-amino-7-oxononanoate aminotransferase